MSTVHAIPCSCCIVNYIKFLLLVCISKSILGISGWYHDHNGTTGFDLSNLTFILGYKLERSSFCAVLRALLIMTSLWLMKVVFNYVSWWCMHSMTMRHQLVRMINGGPSFFCHILYKINIASFCSKINIHHLKLAMLHSQLAVVQPKTNRQI